MIDSSNIRAHQHAAGARKGGEPADQGLGRSRGGWGSKLHLVSERGGKPIRVRLSAGQRHESVEALPLLEETLERMWPDAVAGDKGYSTSAIRNWLAQREIGGAPLSARTRWGRISTTARPTGSERSWRGRSTGSSGTAGSPPGTRNWQPPTGARHHRLYPRSAELCRHALVPSGSTDQLLVSTMVIRRAERAAGCRPS